MSKNTVLHKAFSRFSTKSKGKKGSGVRRYMGKSLKRSKTARDGQNGPKTDPGYGFLREKGPQRVRKHMGKTARERVKKCLEF